MLPEYAEKTIVALSNSDVISYHKQTQGAKKRQFSVMSDQKNAWNFERCIIDMKYVLDACGIPR